MIQLRNSPPFLQLSDGQRPVEHTLRMKFSSAVSLPGTSGLESVTFGNSNGRLLRRRLLRGKQLGKQLSKLVGSVQSPRRTVVTFLARHFRTSRRLGTGGYFDRLGPNGSSLWRSVVVTLIPSQTTPLIASTRFLLSGQVSLLVSRLRTPYQHATLRSLGPAAPSPLTKPIRTGHGSCLP
jgi:hypothetical protein